MREAVVGARECAAAAVEDHVPYAADVVLKARAERPFWNAGGVPDVMRLGSRQAVARLQHIALPNDTPATPTYLAEHARHETGSSHMLKHPLQLAWSELPRTHKSLKDQPVGA